MMEVLQRIRREAAGLNRRILLPEWHDARTLEAAVIMARDKVVRPILVGPEMDVRNA
ncbi:phosphate acetyltransferase, partial [bacterium]|nr:phosphate acetyltransferase [candidate division CSSED10-310 bacterium]